MLIHKYLGNYLISVTIHCILSFMQVLTGNFQAPALIVEAIHSQPKLIGVSKKETQTGRQRSH